MNADERIVQMAERLVATLPRSADGLTIDHLLQLMQIAALGDVAAALDKIGDGPRVEPLLSEDNVAGNLGSIAAAIREATIERLRAEGVTTLPLPPAYRRTRLRWQRITRVSRACAEAWCTSFNRWVALRASVREVPGAIVLVPRWADGDLIIEKDTRSTLHIKPRGVVGINLIMRLGGKPRSRSEADPGAILWAGWFRNRHSGDTSDEEPWPKDAQRTV